MYPRHLAATLFTLAGLWLPVPASATPGLNPVEVTIELGPAPAPGATTTVTATIVARDAVAGAVLTWRSEGVALVGGGDTVALGNLAAGDLRSVAHSVVLPVAGRGVVTAEVESELAGEHVGRNDSVWMIVDGGELHVGRAGWDDIERELLLAASLAALTDPVAARELERALGAGATDTDEPPLTPTRPWLGDDQTVALYTGTQPGQGEHLPPSAIGGTINIWGSVRWKDNYGGVHGAAFVEVEIRDAEAEGSELVTTVVTDSLGGFFVDVPNDDGPDQGGRDLFMRVHARALGYEVRAPGATAPYFIESTVSNNVQNGLKMMGVTANATPNNNTAFGILYLVTEGALYAGYLSGGAPPPGVPVEFPVAGNVSFYNGSGISICLGDRFDPDVVLHEYGHHVQGIFNMSQSGGGAHAFSQNLAETYGKEAGVKLAWGEGYATFFGISCAMDRSLGSERIPWGGDSKYSDHENANNSVSLEDIDVYASKGEDNELAVGRILYDVWDTQEDNRDELTLGEKELFALLRNGTGTLSQAWTRLTNGRDMKFQTKLGTIFADHEVAPDPTSPEEGAAFSAGFSWKRNGAGPSFELDRFHVEFWSQDMTQKLFESPEVTDAGGWLPSAAEAQTITELGAAWWFVRGDNTQGGFATGPYVGPARVVGGGSLGFVVDTSASMLAELPGVTQALGDIVDAFEGKPNAPSVSVIGFEDFPTWGTTTDDLAGVHAILDGMSAIGGSFCPEGSVEALAMAAGTLQSGSSIFLATDADPHEGLDLDGTIADLRSFGHEVNVLVSGRCSCDCEFQTGLGGGLLPEAGPSFPDPPADPPADDHGNGPLTATAVPTDATHVDGWLEKDGDKDWFAFEAEAGVSYRIEVDPTVYFDSLLDIYAPDGTTLVASDDDSGADIGSLVFLTPEVSGTYFARVRGSDAGTYELVVDDHGLPRVDSLEAFSQLAAETGGAFVWVPGVRFVIGGGETDAHRRYRAAARDLALGAFNPVVVDVQPSSARRGTKLVLTLQGVKTQFGNASRVVFSGSGVIAGTPTVRSTRRLEVPVTITAGAPLGFRDVTVTTGSEIAVGHDVLVVSEMPEEPTVTAIVPRMLAFGESATVRVFGAATHFAAGSVPDLGPYVTIDGVEPVSDTELAVDVTVGRDVDVLGLHDVTITTGSEVAAEDVQGPLLVTYPLAVTIPKIAAVEPLEAMPGSELTLTVTGSFTDFLAGEPMPAFAPAGIEVLATRVVDAATLEVDVAIAADAVPGARDLTVAGTSGTPAGLDVFTVLVDPANPPVTTTTLVLPTSTSTSLPPSTTSTSMPHVTTSTTSSTSTTVPTSETSTTLAPSTTSTTLPSCVTDADCDDADPCTLDACTAGACGVEQRTGFDGVLCAFERELAGPACSGVAVPGALGKQFGKARSLVVSARDAAPSKRSEKLLAKAGGRLTKGLRMVERAARRRRAPIVSTCADALMEVVGDARSRVETMRVSDE